MGRLFLGGEVRIQAFAFSSPPLRIGAGRFIPFLLLFRLACVFFLGTIPSLLRVTDPVFPLRMTASLSFFSPFRSYAPPPLNQLAVSFMTRRAPLDVVPSSPPLPHTKLPPLPISPASSGIGTHSVSTCHSVACSAIDPDPLYTVKPLPPSPPSPRKTFSFPLVVPFPFVPPFPERRVRFLISPAVVVFSFY